MKHSILYSALITGALLLSSGNLSADSRRILNNKNIAPTISVDNQIVQSNSVVAVTAIGEDSDGTIVKNAWRQVAGPNVKLKNSKGATVYFIPPILENEYEIVLRAAVWDNDKNKTFTDVTILVTNHLQELSLQGAVTTGATLGTTVSVNAGEYSFKTTTDDKGVYHIDIQLPESALEEIVTITAEGSEENSQLKLVSLVGDLATLSNAAGEDKILTSDELNAVNVTSLTTAYTALMEDANDNQPIVTISQLENAASSFEASRLYGLAATIRLVTEYSLGNESLSLPTNIANTYELVSDIQTGASYLYKAKSEAPTIVSQVSHEILIDSRLTIAGVEANPEQFTDNYYRVDDYFIGSKGYRLILNEDGSGRLDMEYGGDGFNWNAANNYLEFEFLSKNVVTDYLTQGYFNEAGELQQAKGNTVITNRQIRWIKNSSTIAHMIYRDTVVDHFPDGEIPDSEPYFVYGSSNFVKEAVIINPAEVIKLGAIYSLPHPKIEMEITDSISEIDSHDVYAIETSFLGDLTDGGSVKFQMPIMNGNGSWSSYQVSGAWYIDDNNHLVIEQGDIVYDLVFLKSDKGEIVRTNTSILNVNTGVQQAKTDNLLLHEINWDEDTVAGIYDVGMYFDAPYYRLWHEFIEGGSGFTVFVYDINLDGEYTDDEVFRNPTKWQINDVGDIVYRRYRRNASFETCESEKFEPDLESDCVLYHERDLKLSRANESGTHYVKQVLRVYDDTRRSELYPGTEGHIIGRSNPTTVNRTLLKLDTAPVTLPEVESAGSSLEIHDSKKISKQILGKIKVLGLEDEFF